MPKHLLEPIVFPADLDSRHTHTDPDLSLAPQQPTRTLTEHTLPDYPTVERFRYTTATSAHRQQVGRARGCGLTDEVASWLFPTYLKPC